MTKHNGPPRLPAKQLAILAVARFAEPLAMTSVFPYLPEMIASFGVDEDDIAGWAGTTSAVFSLSQSLFAVGWGRASDRFGRKPVIILGLLCTMMCFLVWGVSSSLPMAIVVRAIQGASNGNVGIIRTMVAEMVPEKELQAKAFSIMPLVWSIGSIFGPAFGGFFAKPAVQFPSIFGDSPFFNKYPFALPNIMGSVIFLISVATAILFLKETLASKRNSRDWGLVLGKRIADSFKSHGRHNPRRYSFQDGEATAPLLQTGHSKYSRHQPSQANAVKPTPPGMSSVFTRSSSINLVAYTFLALHSVAFDQVLPVFLNFKVKEHDGSNTHLPFIFTGGFGLESGSIGTIFMLYGIVCGLVQFIVFPPLCNRFGVLACFRACVLIFPGVYFAMPYIVLIERERLKFMALLALLFVKGFAVIVAFPCSTILLTNSARSLSILGTLNGFAVTFSGLGRAMGPLLAGSVFSWGVKRGIIGVSWWVLAAIAFVGAFPVWWIVEEEGPSRDSQEDDDADMEDENDEEAILEDDEEDERLQPQQPPRLGRERSRAIVFGDGTDEFDAAEDDAIIFEPGAHDDLPLVGSMRSSSPLANYGNMKRRLSDRR